MRLKLREMRKSLNISQTEFAKMIGASLRSVGAWERGENTPDAEQIWNCSVALGCTPNDLLGWYDDHPKDTLQALSNDEDELLENYRSCTPEWKRTLAMNSIAAKGESLKSAEIDPRNSAKSEKLAM